MWLPDQKLELFRAIRSVFVPPKTMAAVNPFPSGDASVQRWAGLSVPNDHIAATVLATKPTHKAMDAIAAKRRRGNKAGTWFYLCAGPAALSRSGTHLEFK